LENLPKDSTSSPSTLAAFWNGQTSVQEDERTFGDEFSMHFLSTYWDNSTLFAYYIRTEPLSDGTYKTSTHLALSKDGIGFENQGRVLEGDESGARDTRIASFPSVLKRDGTWYMLYEGASDSSLAINGELRLAVSADGKKWQKHPDPVWVPSADWQIENVGTPTLWEEDGTWYVIYHGYDGAKLQLGVLTGSDLFALTPANGNQPVLVTGSDPNDFDSGTIGKRSIRKEGGVYYMVYEGSTAIHPQLGWGGAHWGIGLARSYDLIHWEKFPDNPILRNPELGFGHDGPEFVETPDGKLHIYFRNSSGSTSRASFG
jgi:predicted GH43/DUF377 family glycosyl hydrolase